MLRIAMLFFVLLHSANTRRRRKSVGSPLCPAQFELIVDACYREESICQRPVGAYGQCASGFIPSGGTCRNDVNPHCKVQPRHPVEQTHAHKDRAWGYESSDGPDTWGGVCATGQRQSPIDIRTADLQIAQMEALRFVNFHRRGRVQLQNNGHTLVVSGFSDWTRRPHIRGGALHGIYLLEQFHLHWAQADGEGSEHSVNSLHYPAELHFVHVKRGLSFHEALRQQDGLAVVAVFFHLGPDGRALQRMSAELAKEVEKGSTTAIADYSPGEHLPSSVGAFYRYNGSLTTPACEEVVVWSVLAQPVPIRPEQLELLRSLNGPVSGKRLKCNSRSVQPLNGRKVLFRIAPDQMA